VIDGQPASAGSAITRITGIQGGAAFAELVLPLTSEQVAAARVDGTGHIGAGQLPGAVLGRIKWRPTPASQSPDSSDASPLGCMPTCDHDDSSGSVGTLR
jgi:hypothetical protein